MGFNKNNQLAAFLAMSMAISKDFPFKNQQENKGPDLDWLEKEYNLIKQKKSKLSANKRAWVVQYYERLNPHLKTIRQ